VEIISTKVSEIVNWEKELPSLIRVSGRKKHPNERQQEPKKTERGTNERQTQRTSGCPIGPGNFALGHAG